MEAILRYMNQFDQDKYEKAKRSALNFFSKNKKITSLCFGSIYLNSEGFKHLIFKNNKHKRDWKNQVKRFYLLNYIKPVLEGMKYYQEYIESLEEVEAKDKNTTKFILKTVCYWAFVAVIDNKIRIKIILKKIGGGQVIFWSIIPYWKTQNYKDIKVITLHKGNLTED